MLKYKLPAVVLMLASLASANPPTKGEINAAKKNGVAYLMSIVQADGAWEPPVADDQPWRISSIVALSLLDAGEDPAKNPKLQNAIDRISAVNYMPTVEAMGRRMELLANPVFKIKYRKALSLDLEDLMKGTRDGMFAQKLPLRPDLRNNAHWGSMNATYIAWMGLQEAGGQVPESAWQVLARTLMETQDHHPKKNPVPGYPAPKQNTGGWRLVPYDTDHDADISSTASAMILLTFAKDRIKAKAEKVAIDACLKGGFDYLDANCAEGKLYITTLLALQRLGKLSNRKQFGGKIIDDAGCEYIQTAPGGNLFAKEGLSQARPETIALHLMFLSRL